MHEIKLKLGEQAWTSMCKRLGFTTFIHKAFGGEDEDELVILGAKLYLAIENGDEELVIESLQKGA